jgi:hypothetical protein
VKRIAFSGLIGIAAIYAFLALRVEAREGASSGTRSRSQWEYKTLDCYEDKALAQMGNEGWEMVAVVDTITKWEFSFYTPAIDGRNRSKLSDSNQASGNMVGHGSCKIYLKRQK